MNIKIHNKSFLISIMILIMMGSGCVSVTKDETVPHELTFRSFETKAGSASTTLPSTMGIFANLSLSPEGTPGGTAWGTSEYFHSVDPDNGYPWGQFSALYLNGVCFAKVDGVYTGANADDISQQYPYYWPASGSLLFSAYAPHISQSNGSIDEVYIRNHKDPKDEGYMTIKVALRPNIASSTPVDTPFELFYADTKHIGTDVSMSNETRPIPVQMKHAMSKVTFNFTDQNSEIKISGKLLHVLNSAWFYSGMTPGWVPDFNNQSNPLTINKILKFKTGTTPEGKEKLEEIVQLTPTPAAYETVVIPMQLNGIYPSVTQNLDKHVFLSLILTNKDGIGHQNKLIDMSSITQTWKPGLHYIYNVSVSPKKIEFAEPIIINLDHQINP